VAVPVAADESIRRASDPLEVARQDAADIMVVKVQPLGGVRAALEIIEQVGLPAVVSSALNPRWGSPPGSRSRRRCPSFPSPAGSRRSTSLPPTPPRAPSCPRAGPYRSDPP